MGNDDYRFKKEKVKQGMLSNYEIIIDQKTGVQYLWYQSGYAGGLTPLLDRDGKPLIATKSSNDFEKNY